MEPLALALLLSSVNKALLDFVVSIIRQKFPNADLWWFDLVSLVTGSILAWFSQVNALSEFVQDPTLGRIVTCLMVGAGANLLNQILGSVPAANFMSKRAVGRGISETGEDTVYPPRGW